MLSNEFGVWFSTGGLIMSLALLMLCLKSALIKSITCMLFLQVCIAFWLTLFLVRDFFLHFPMFCILFHKSVHQRFSGAPLCYRLPLRALLMTPHVIPSELVAESNKRTKVTPLNEHFRLTSVLKTCSYLYILILQS